VKRMNFGVKERFTLVAPAAVVFMIIIIIIIM
jgi:hypothetical protein